MIAMALVHWLISRGIYLVNVRVYDINGVEIPSRARYGRAMSPLPLLLALLLGTAMWITLFILMGKRLGRGMPIIGTCSAAISAACHPPTEKGVDATRALMYGVVSKERTDPGIAFAAGENQVGREQVSFSNGDVRPLIVDRDYVNHSE
jgi:hypothetical protein